LKYKGLLEGREVNIINFLDIGIDNEVFRYDAEYFNKGTKKLIANIRNNNHFIIEDEFDVSKLAGFEFTSYFTEQNINSDDYYIALTSKNVQNEKLDLKEYITIDKDTADDFLNRSKLLKNDVVLSYTGEYRRSLVMFENGFQLGPNVCRLRPKNNVDLSFYLSTFFNSKIGQTILDREKTLSAQPTLAMKRIRKIPVPLFSNIIKLKEIISQSYSNLTRSHALYTQAEDLLLSTLGLYDFTPRTDNITIKNITESFLKSGRLDAEYYQPKYEEMEEKIKEFDYAKVKDLVTFINHGKQPPYEKDGTIRVFSQK